MQRAWKRAGLQPHRIERYMRSTDPDFETKAADVLGLYLAPPQHAAVFCLDDKTAIQALDRVDPRLPLSPGRAERHGFEYKRHGTLSLYAALNTQTGEVIGQTAARHTSADFLTFLTDVAASQSPRREIHIILDKLSTHRTQAVRAFLAQHRRRAVALHAHVIVVAESSRALVRQDRARHHGARHLHVGRGSEAQDHEVHPALQQGPQADSVDLREPDAAHCLNRCTSLVYGTAEGHAGEGPAFNFTFSTGPCWKGVGAVAVTPRPRTWPRTIAAHCPP